MQIFCIMTEPRVESVFGENAGIVWKALNKKGPSTIGKLVKITSLSREEVYGALGWLGRENKILLERRKRTMVFSLREEEVRLKAFEDTTIDSAPQKQSKSRKGMHPKKTQKKTPKPGKVKAPIKQSERMDEFLLH